IAGAGNERVIVEIEDPVGTERSRRQEFSWRDHCVSRLVVTQGLKLEVAISEQRAEIISDADIIGIDIKAANRPQIAEAEVVRLHRRMITTIEGLSLPFSQQADDECSRRNLIKQAMIETHVA